MVTKKQLMQRLIRRYKDETGNIEVDMREVAKFALQIEETTSSGFAEDRLQKNLRMLPEKK